MTTERSDTNIKCIQGHVSPKRPADTADADPDSLTVEVLRRLLTHAKDTCESLRNTRCELDFVMNEEKEQPTGSDAGPGELLLRRRAVVFDDALREAAIGGDRLWSFAKQLAGITSETVESVMAVDDTAVVREQQELRKLRARAIEDAAKTQASIVQQVFKAALADAGIQLGVHAVGEDDVKFRLISSGFRKHIAELTNRPSAESGFFSNAVQLENALSSGPADMTMSQLFNELSGVGKRLQEDALRNIASDRGSATGHSMDVIGAPRNCLFIHWKPQAKSAIRQAFDIFTRERRYIEPNMRDILVWELIEGVSEPLCNAFAELCGLMMANARMTNPTNMVYVSQQSMRTTGRAIKLSISRLINEACRYSSQHGRPSLDAKGVDAYFGLT
jgi:hypothetical protein